MSRTGHCQADGHIQGRKDISTEQTRYTTTELNEYRCLHLIAINRERKQDLTTNTKLLSIYSSLPIQYCEQSLQSCQ